MRIFNKYLVIALLSVGSLSSSFLVNDVCCLAATVCPYCGIAHEGKCASKKHVCPECGKEHEGKCASVRQSQGQGGDRSKSATFLSAFTGASATKSGSLTAGVNVIHAQSNNLVNTNFTPYTYGYRNGYRVLIKQ